MPGSSYSVLGLAKSGVAAANALARRGYSVLASDPRDEDALAEFVARLDPRVEVALGGNVVREGDVVVASPGIPPSAPILKEALRRGSELIGEIALFQRLEPDRDVLAVTGTDGKSTTTAWLGEMCAASGRPTWVGGNLGTPLCEAVGTLEEDSIVVAEVSCFQLSTAAEFHPRVAAFTNLAPDHLNYYDGSYEAYVAAKKRLLAHLGPGEAMVAKRSDPILRTWSAPAGARTLWTDTAPFDEEGAFVRDGVLIARLDGAEIDLGRARDLPLPGQHNVENALMAATAALAFGLDVGAVRSGLSSFRGLEHRLRLVRTTKTDAGEVRWYNDSKATNPHAAMAALRAFGEERIVVLCGGSEKYADFGPWADLASRSVRHAVCFGATGPRMADALGDRVPVTRVGTLAEAVSAAAQVVGDAGIVALSPGCASFDQFQSFEHRGEVFRDLVAAL